MDLLTQRQLARLPEVEHDHLIVGERAGCPVLRRADGQLLLVQPNGRLVTTRLIARVQSYLDVPAS